MLSSSTLPSANQIPSQWKSDAKLNYHPSNACTTLHAPVFLPLSDYFFFSITFFSTISPSLSQMCYDFEKMPSCFFRRAIFTSGQFSCWALPVFASFSINSPFFFVCAAGGCAWKCVCAYPLLFCTHRIFALLNKFAWRRLFFCSLACVLNVSSSLSLSFSSIIIGLSIECETSAKDKWIGMERGVGFIWTCKDSAI